MSENLFFSNNEGLGGFEKGAYDLESKHPVDVNWTRQSRYIIPNQPKLKWKVVTNHAHINETMVKGAFVIDRDGNAIISDCDNNLVGQHHGKIIQVSSDGEKKELFRTDKRLKSPVIGKYGRIYFTSTGYMDSTGHKLFCLLPDGTLKWEFIINHSAHSKPVIDEDGNIYIYTYGNRVGTLFSIRDNGELNWERKFNSVNWFEPIISKDGIIYVGFNVNQTLCAFDKNGQRLWERKLGYGLGSYPINIKNDGTIYACISSTLYALNPDGSTHWKYVPLEGIVVTSPAIDKEGDLYINLNTSKLVSLNSEGLVKWQSSVKGEVNLPPIIGRCNRLYQQSSTEKSWIESFSKDGKKIWTYQLDGNIVSTVLAGDNLLYALSNCYTGEEKLDQMDNLWELHAIGN